MPTVAFVLNQTLVRDQDRLIRQCTTAARDRGWEPVFLPTARAAAAAGAGLVFAAGGDGTVRACAQALGGTGVPLAIIPLGTANLTARAMGVPHRVSHAVKTGFDGEDRRIDLARADESVFTAMAGIGLDAAVVGATRQPHKRRLGWIAYAASGAARLSLPPVSFTIRMDDGEPLTRTARCVVVGNAGLLPGGFPLLPAARVDDGLLDVGILSPRGVLGWALVAGQMLIRDRHERRHLERYQARRVEISSATDLPREADGELLAPGPALTVTVWPGALIVRC